MHQLLKSFCFSALLLISTPVWSQTAAQIIQNAVDKTSDGSQSMESIIQDVEKAATTASASNKRSLYSFLGSLTEQLGDYEAASTWYAKAAGIAAAPAPGTPSLTSEELVLAAVRCSLSYGNNQQADSYLASLTNTTSEDTMAYYRLYKMWSWLCNIQSSQDLLEPVAVLETYATMDSMKVVRPPVYLTLWYLTGKDEWSKKLEKEYPKSAETALVTGSAHMLPTPFWFFLPRDEVAINNTSSPTRSDLEVTSSSSSSSGSGESHVVIKQQVGFFRSKVNAENLASRLRDAGFRPDITEEQRQSGTVYFVVTVPEDEDNSTGLRLKTAGFECYPVFADE